LLNWYGKNCSRFCDNSSKRYTCSREGHKVCLSNWIGVNCETFCDRNADTFKCDGDGTCYDCMFR
jgi:hypothetical protein